MMDEVFYIVKIFFFPLKEIYRPRLKDSSRMENFSPKNKTHKSVLEKEFTSLVRWKLAVRVHNTFAIGRLYQLMLKLRRSGSFVSLPNFAFSEICLKSAMVGVVTP